MTIIVREIEDRETWLGWRKGCLTGSDMGAVAGVDPHRSALAVYAEKAGWIGGAEENNLMRRGRWLEAATREALRDEYPELEIRPAGVFVEDDALHIGATPDTFAFDPAEPGRLINIQMKAVSRPVFERDWADDNVPLHILLQVLTEAMLTGAPINRVAALVIDTYSAELVMRDVPRHAGAEDRIRDLAASFWANLKAGVRPTPDYTRDAETIGAIHHADKYAQAIDLTGDNRLAELLPERMALVAAQKAAGERQAEIDAEIKDKLGASEHGFLPGYKLSWKEETRKAFTVASSTRRVLRVSPIKEDAA